MLEGIINIILSEPPRYVLVRCRSLLEHAAWPRMDFALSSWYGDDAGGGSSPCSRGDCSRPNQNYPSAVNNLCCCYSFTGELQQLWKLYVSPVGLRPSSPSSAPQPDFCQHKLQFVQAQQTLFSRSILSKVRCGVSGTSCWGCGYFHSFLPKITT